MAIYFSQIKFVCQTALVILLMAACLPELEEPEDEDEFDTYFDGLQPGTLDVFQPEKTANKINEWIAGRTNDMIKDAVSPGMIKPDLAAMLANALYFKGVWKEEFDPELTVEAGFNVVTKDGDARTEDVATMTKFDPKLQIATHGDYVSIRLPYQGETHAMYISFASQHPFAGTITQVDAAHDVSQTYRDMIVKGGAFDADYVESTDFDRFTMPKFTIETTLENIQNELIAGGYAGLFAPGALSNLSDDHRLALSFILQKAKIIVNEEGSEASVVTIGGIEVTSVRLPQYLQVDGPFAYAIRDDVNGVVLFEGIVRDPTSDE